MLPVWQCPTAARMKKNAKAKSKLGINWTFKDLHTYTVERWKFSGWIQWTWMPWGLAPSIVGTVLAAFRRLVWRARFHSYATRLFYLIFRVEWNGGKGKTRKHILYVFFFRKIKLPWNLAHWQAGIRRLMYARESVFFMHEPGHTEMLEGWGICSHPWNFQHAVSRFGTNLYGRQWEKKPQIG